jgi:SAM-dependent methyltransferase
MTQLAVDYVFGEATPELQRLIGQAQDLATESKWLLDAIGVSPGWKVADIGCGPIGIVDLLSERVGSTGSVTGVERETTFLEMAQRELRRRGLTNATIVQGDALAPPLPETSFDLVHERLLLINMPIATKRAVVARMVSLARLGGIVASESWDRASLVCYPEHPSWPIMDGAYRNAIRPTNGDGTSGRTLPSLLHSAGLTDVRCKVHVRAPAIGDPRRCHRLQMFEAAKPKILAAGLLSESEFTEHARAVADHLADPTTLLIDQLFIQAWGRRTE